MPDVVRANTNVTMMIAERVADVIKAGDWRKLRNSLVAEGPEE